MNETPEPNAMPGSSPTPAGPPPPPPGPVGYQAPPPPPGQTGYTPPPPPKKASNKLGLIILGILGVIVVGGVIYAFLTRDSSLGDASSLLVGDCVDRPAQSDSITEIQHQPCNTPHDAEVIHNFTNPAGPDEPYPVVSGFDDFVLDICVPVFESYVGRDWETDTELNIGWLAPTLTGWTNDKDRSFTCYVFRLDDGQVTSTVMGAGSSPLPSATP